MEPELLASVRHAARNELTEHAVHSFLAKRARGRNKVVLRRIAKDELRHAQFWSRLAGEEFSPRPLVVRWYAFLARVFGLSFALRLMERGEDLALHAYRRLSHIDGVRRIIKDEELHEQLLLGLLHEERLEYAGSLVLGLNDALVELTGALAGMTLALQDGRLVAIAGLVTGIAAAMSMAASEFLSSEEEGGKDARKAAFYTGLAYTVTVALLITPYFLFANVFVALAVTLAVAVLVILAYTFYTSVARQQRFWARFVKMTVISLGVAGVSFLVGLGVHAWLGVS